MVQLYDAIKLDGPRTVRDGYVVVDARVSRTGIQIYTGKELGDESRPMVRVYRPEEEVFKDEAMASFAHIPVTNDHPPVPVTSKNWKEFSVGITGDSVARDKGFVRVPMMLLDQDTIDQVNAGKKELSCGYSSNVEFVDGISPEGEPYDAIMRDIRGNHLAIVQNGRAGGDCRIGDSGNKSKSPSTATEGTPPMHKLTIDGISIELSDTAREVVSKLMDQHSKVQKQLSDATTAHTAAIAAKDAELAKRDATIDDLKSKVMDGATLDAAVKARGDLIAKAKAIAPDVVCDGKSAEDICKDVVVAKIGDAAIKDKSAEYINARFDILADSIKDTGTDPFRQHVADTKTSVNHQDADKAYLTMVDGLTSDWKGATKGGNA